MPTYSEDQIKRSARLKNLVDLARRDLEVRRGPGWSEAARSEAAAHVRHCQDMHQAFLDAIAADDRASWPG